MPKATKQNKYSTTMNHLCDAFIGQTLSENEKKLVTASYCSNSWKKNSSAINCLKEFSRQTNCDIKFPVEMLVANKFVEWCHFTKNIKASTVRSYISCISTAQRLNNLDDSAWKNPILKQMIKGMENLEFYSEICKGSRKVMTLPLLKIVGNQISKANWSDDTKQVLWTIFVTAFFGSFRLGEILCEDEKSFNPLENLTWNDIIFREDNSVLIKLKITKTKKKQGEYIDLFQFKGHKCCPVATLQKLKNSRLAEKFTNMPVFMFKNGKLVTPNMINKILPDLLRDVMKSAADEYTGHCLRPGIPSALASCPDIAKDKDVKKWGRWDSTSFLLYTRLKLNQKKILFEKITNVLDRQ